ncbi:MAG TPA: hypothetical protein DCZ41_02655 [Firmicutes bacterium]|nr:hypothetical protein [Bacillota bacterium]
MLFFLKQNCQNAKEKETKGKKQKQKPLVKSEPQNPGPSIGNASIGIRKSLKLIPFSKLGVGQKGNSEGA